MGTTVLGAYRDVTFGLPLGNDFGTRLQANSLQVLIPALLTMPFIRNYFEEIAVLDQQLSDFSCCNAKCFCCKVDHVHPDTGLRIPCDRKLIYASISHWYGSGEAGDGQPQFDAVVNGRIGKEIKRSLGLAGVPYTHALIVA